jgi:hypothetical protein
MEDKRTYPELTSEVAAAAGQIAIGGVYRHYKNQHLYEVMGFGVLEATNQIAVLYQPQGEGSNLTFVRPVSEWLEAVDGVARFTREQN